MVPIARNIVVGFFKLLIDVGGGLLNLLIFPVAVGVLKLLIYVAISILKLLIFMIVVAASLFALIGLSKILQS